MRSTSDYTPEQRREILRVELDRVQKYVKARKKAYRLAHMMSRMSDKQFKYIDAQLDEMLENAARKAQ